MREQDGRGRIEKAEQKAEQRGEQKQKIAIAKEMKADNEPIDKIMRYTGLSREEIEKLWNCFS